MDKNLNKTSLFVLFKEYADSNKLASRIYLESDNIVNSDIFIQYFNEWMEIIEFFQYEICNRFFDRDNIKGALYPYELLADEYNEQDDEFPNTALYVQTQLNRLGITDWKDEIEIELNESFWYNDYNVTNDLLGIIAKLKADSRACILLNCKAINNTKPIVLTTQSKPDIIIEQTNNLKNLYSWFCNNRVPHRVFDYNKKHGDYKHKAQMISGTQRRAAQLKISCEKAQELLHLAIGTDPKSPLWLYDESVGEYIYFENQQEQRLAFHGYHLQPGEENYNNIDKKKLILVQKNIV